MLNPLDHPICFAAPHRLVPSEWLEHLPFGMFLIDIVRPSLVVELGTRDGVSYCGFCQAVQRLGVTASCVAVAPGRQEFRTELVGPNSFAEFQAHHDPLYGSFSRVLRCESADALNSFEKDSIDLLHVDGCDTYEEFERDLEAWLARMSRRGVILLHDINVRDRGAGGWKLWREIKDRFPHLEFYHGRGLGLIAVGESCAPELRALLDAGAETMEDVRSFFHALGARVALQARQLELPTKSDVEVLVAQASDQEHVIQAQSHEGRYLSAWVVDLVETIARRDESIASLTSTVATHEQALQTLTSALTQSEQSLRNLDVEIVERERVIQSLGQEIDAHRHTIEALNREMTARQHSIEALNRELAGHQRTIGALNSEIVDRDRLTAALTVQISEWQGHWAAVQLTSGWRFALRLRRVRAFLAPPHSKRERVWYFIMHRKQVRDAMRQEAS